MSEWQPIETAPKDGTYVLLYGVYQWNNYFKKNAAPAIVVGFFYSREWDDDQYWQLIGANPYTDRCQPTHWMPLPAAPQI